MKSSPRRATPAANPALLAAALRAQAEGVLIAEPGNSPEGLRILFANESLCTMTGRSARELIGAAHGILHADKSDVVQTSRWPQGTSARRSRTGEGFLLRKDGTTFYAAWSFSPILTRKRLTHVIATYRDTTEKRRLQEALVHSQRLDAVGRLAGGVAHDFNNLLSVISGYSEMLAAKITDRPQALRDLEEIRKSGQRASALTRQLLTFGRRQPMNPRVTNLNRIVQENAEILGRIVAQAGTLELELGENVGNVRTDANQFQQVLLNLVINARDALRDHGRITISTANRTIKTALSGVTEIPPGDYVALIVKDNGTGMDAETQQHLFEPFFTTKPEGKGTGLGLALVYGIVQESNGHIRCHSALLAGTTFEIFLPRIHEPELASAEAVPLPALPAARGHEMVLLIEKDAVVRKMVAGMLTADGYRVLAAESAYTARELVQKSDRPIELLIGPPDHQTEGLGRELLIEKANLRFLGIGNQDVPLPVGWLTSGRQAGLAKPFALSEVSRQVRTLLDA